MFKTKSKTKRLLMISGILCGAGILIAAVAFAFCGFDFWKVCAAPDYQESSYTYSADGISSLKLDFKGPPVEIRTSPDDKIHVTAWENDVAPQAVQMKKLPLFLLSMWRMFKTKLLRCGV